MPTCRYDDERSVRGTRFSTVIPAELNTRVLPMLLLKVTDVLEGSRMTLGLMMYYTFINDPEETHVVDFV